ncbi:TlpA disulfide reductase family protein [Rhodocytophaga aerolata]|uniref:TlpA disulfide reductase family protein n=1 Tax=Rhodocytophaga aerolata TaxID=455078 RepID=A0ABT8RKH3_9BACT|nr:TlpA disulfide reductase family protein [Rhodocytophaga aerolata]MDO1451883.1 TlpA disulfide reductase family protein [Rhodocytophaga aerolata]
MQKLYSLLVLFYLSSLGLAEGQTYQEQYAKCAQKLEGSKLGSEEYMNTIESVLDCMLGAKAPDFTAKSITNQEIILSKLKGQVVVVNFWNTGCQPCVEEMPALNELVEIYKGKAVTFIALAPEDEMTIKTFLDKYPFHFTQIAAASDIITKKFMTNNVYPYTVIIDQAGRVKKIWFGGTADKEKTFKRFHPPIAECLAKSKE